MKQHEQSTTSIRTAKALLYSTVLIICCAAIPWIIADSREIIMFGWISIGAAVLLLFFRRSFSCLFLPLTILLLLFAGLSAMFEFDPKWGRGFIGGWTYLLPVVLGASLIPITSARIMTATPKQKIG